MADRVLRLKGGQVLRPDGSLIEADVVLQQGRVAAVGPGLTTEAEVDASGCTILPGLIELHTHGMQGQSAETGDLAAYARVMATLGATTFYPTLFCAPDRAVEHLARHRRETDDLAAVPQVPGFRLESPYLAIPSGGTDQDVTPVSDAVTERLLAAGAVSGSSTSLVKIWDLSPELDGAVEAIRRITGQGIVCSIAHTRASIAQGRAAVAAGARLVTHLFDVFYHTPERKDPDPDIYAPGLVDYLLLEDRVVCEIVGDGTHVDPLLVEKAFRCKGPAGLAFVTDSNLASGMPPGRYTMPGSWGDVVIRSGSDGVRLPDREMILAGSALSPIEGLRNVIRLFGKDLATASRLWSANPARLMGLNKGEVAVGRDADLIVVDANLDLVCTIVAGEIAFHR
ncbi:MAG: amidohydrolase family protein [Candidatus Latescibacterota bacterium]|jgi:N-acetylglucosamine-6-phosphate deacetylase